MNITETVNLLKNQAATNVKEKLLTQANKETDATEEDTSVDSTFGSEANGEDFNTFLTLLTAQIKNQDPLAPLDSTQFVEQLATFSGLELTAKSNVSLSRIEVLLEQQIALLEADVDTSTSAKTTLKV